jgi:hypothetical protein
MIMALFIVDLGTGPLGRFSSTNCSYRYPL